MSDLTVQELVDELCDLYRTLIRHLTPTQGGSEQGYQPPSKPGSRPAAVLAISHQRAQIDLEAEDIALRARDHLGFIHRKPVTTSHVEHGWLMNNKVCTVATITVTDYATVATLRALPALLEALPTLDERRGRKRLDKLRAKTRITLGIDKAPMRLPALCPECQGWTVPLLLQQETLLADPEKARVWCCNPQCGYLCGNGSCWCAIDDGDRHRMVWTATDLLRLSRLLESA